MIKILPVLCILPLLTVAQFFPVSDGINDLFAVFTQCPITPRSPPENQYFCYRTQARMLFGFTVCDPVFVRQRNLTVGVKSENYTVYFLNTPGRRRGANYVNRLLCRWNIRCPAGQLMYYDVPEHSLEASVVSPFFSNSLCLDFLRMSRDFGEDVSCGNDIPRSDIEPSRILVEFRSNRVMRRPGFRMRVVCFNPKLQDAQGCTARGRRSSELHKIKMKQKAARILRSLVNQPHKKLQVSPDRLIQNDIPRDATVVYSRETIFVFRKKSVLFVYRKVKSLHTYNEFDGVTSFYKAEKKTEIFRGFGVLTVVDVYAYYTIFGVDPSLRPPTGDKNIISTLLDAHEVLTPDDDFIIPNLAPQNIDKRQASGQTVSPGVISIAQSNSNSCNPVLKAVAQSLLNKTGNK
ncbi:PREDICTED: uncharacterized protein LOC109581220 [Amphimedon queenslandica]|uniref:CUB domain-containing protein n=1 Tax=Amphimedon queenslandica TaxID=400682 RepID=A0A1X7VUU8_AMPQE|nr:PREDICTED: uncharacterized protein LOC109581220 [Amphimedon queenslandica]|eukprot:XP_019850683.1 PREDICTED: uncharacterized protein LOC109581220 [Amphimedon queenslandica]